MTISTANWFGNDSFSNCLVFTVHLTGRQLLPEWGWYCFGYEFQKESNTGSQWAMMHLPLSCLPSLVVVSIFFACRMPGILTNEILNLLLFFFSSLPLFFFFFFFFFPLSPTHPPVFFFFLIVLFQISFFLIRFFFIRIKRGKVAKIWERERETVKK